MTERQEDEGRDESGRIKPGYALWRQRKTHGRNALYDDQEQLWTACCAYFDEAYDNPLHEDKVVTCGGEAVHVPISKMRAFTIKGLCIHLHIADETWRDWRTNRDDLIEVIGTVDAIIYAQKFEGAAAGLFNANIIARDLGLSEKSELTGKNGGPIETKGITDLELARRLAFLLSAGDQH